MASKDPLTIVSVLERVGHPSVLPRLSGHRDKDLCGRKEEGERMSEGRRKHSREFKIEVVGLLENGKSGKEVEEVLGIASGMVYR